MEYFKLDSKLLYDFIPYPFADFVLGVRYSYKNEQNVLPQKLLLLTDIYKTST